MGAFFGPGGNGRAFYADAKRSTSEAPQWLRSYGLDAYEYEAGNGLRASETFLKDLGRRASEEGIKLSLHAPYFISLSSAEKEKRDKSVEYIHDSVNAAALMGADTVVVHPGGCGSFTRGEAMELAKDTLFRYMEKYGTCGIRIGLETMGVKKQLGTLDEVLELASLGGDLSVTVDFGHINARECGGAFSTPGDYERVFCTVAEKLGDDAAKNLHCHFSKIEWSLAGERRHLTFSDDGFGPSFEPFCEAIYRLRVSPTVICESAGTQAEDALTMKRYYLDFFKGGEIYDIET